MSELLIAEPRSRGKIRLAVLIVLTLLAATWCWFRPVRPLWSEAAGNRFWWIAGISNDGRIVCLDTERSLHIRDVTSGRNMAEYSLPSPCVMSQAKLAGDGRYAVLLTSDRGLLVIDTLTGQLRTPRIELTGTGSIDVSPRGDFALVTQAPGNINRQRRTSVIDLCSGQKLWSSDELLAFGDDQHFVASEGGDWFQSLTLLTVTTGHVLKRIPIPELGDRQATFARQPGNGRIYLTFGYSPSNREAAPAEAMTLWSCRLQDEQLVDVRREPFPAFDQSRPGQSAYPIYGDQLTGLLQTEGLSRTLLGRVQLNLQEAAGSAGIPIDSRSWSYSWQSVTPLGQRIGQRIPIPDSVVAYSRDGKWLATGGTRMAVYSLPPRSRLPETLAVLLGPAILYWLLSRRRAPRVLTNAATKQTLG